MKKIILLSVLIILGILFSAQIKRGGLSFLILIDSVRSPEKALMGRLIDGPTQTKVTVRGRGRTVHADLYRPHRQGVQYPLLLAHGVDPAGKDEERIVLLANNLARAGFLVIVPDLKGMKTLRIRLSDAEDILQSFLYLIKEKQAGPLGCMVGISYGAGPLLLAAADPRIRDNVSVVATFGGYYDLRSVMSFALTGAYEYGGEQGYVRPESSLRWMFAYKNLDLLHSSDDRTTFKKIIEKRNHYEIADAESLARSLGPEGKKLHAFLVNDDRDRFALLYENLPLTVREYMYQLSPARAIKYISASFIVIHAYDDHVVPYSESMRLADAVNDKQRVRLALLPQFMHGEPIKPSPGNLYRRYVLGGWRLFAAIYELLKMSSREEAVKRGGQNSYHGRPFTHPGKTGH